MTFPMPFALSRHGTSGGALGISGSPVLTAVDGVAYDGFTVAASGGTAPYTYSLVGTWPTGITINSSTGEVSGTPTQNGTFGSLSVRVTDDNSDTADLATFTIESLTSSGLVLWLDPAAITGKTQGNTVTSWTDKSGSGNDAAEATNPPTYDDGSDYNEGVPGLIFDATAEKLNVAADVSLSNTQATYIIIARLLEVNPDQGASSSCWLFNKRNTNPATVGVRVTVPGYEALYRLEGSEGTVNLISNDSFVDQAVSMHVVRATGTAVRYEIATAAGGLKLVTEDSVAAGLDDDNHNTLTIGNHPTSDNPTLVDRIIYDVIAYNRDMTDSEVNQLVDWFKAKHVSEYVKLGELFPATEYFSCNIFIDGSTAYLTYVKRDGVSIGYMTAPTSDPHNWTDQGTIFTASNATRSARLCKDGSTWHLYYDDRVNGTIRVATGAAIGSLSDYGSNPILSGSGTGWETYVRHGFVLTPAEAHGSSWEMLYDGRDTSPTSGVGAVGHATSSDGLSWTRDTANNPILSASGTDDFEGNDVGEPHAYWDGSTYHVFWAGYRDEWDGLGFNLFPHHLGRGTSTDLTSVTRSTANPILPLSQDDTDFDTNSHLSPCPYYPGDGNFYLYYSGVDYTSDFEFHLGYAKRRDGLP